jgi:hypothetical protein
MSNIRANSIHPTTIRSRHCAGDAFNRGEEDRSNFIEWALYTSHLRRRPARLLLACEAGQLLLGGFTRI